MKYNQPHNETDPNATYKDFNLDTGEPGSIPPAIVPAEAIESPQREIVAAITAAGLTPDGNDNTQLTQAIDAKISAATEGKADNDLSNLSSAGQTVIDGKANADASNFTATGKSVLSGLAMPSKRAVNITPGASGARYTAPGNGYFTAYNANGANGAVRFVNITKGIGMNSPAVSNFSDGLSFVPAEKNDIVDMFYTGTFNTTGNGWFRFVYAEGENNV